MGINDLWRLARAMACVLKLNLVAACISYSVQNVMVDMSVYIGGGGPENATTFCASVRVHANPCQSVLGGCT